MLVGNHEGWRSLWWLVVVVVVGGGALVVVLVGLGSGYSSC